MPNIGHLLPVKLGIQLLEISIFVLQSLPLHPYEGGIDVLKRHYGDINQL